MKKSSDVRIIAAYHVGWMCELGLAARAVSILG
jgi:hypothetical protein